MNTLTIVDTDILIDAAHQISEAIDCLDEIEQRSTLAISAITQMELFVGCRNKTELRKTERFLQRFRVLRLNKQISDTAVHHIALLTRSLIPPLSENDTGYAPTCSRLHVR